MNRGSYDTSPAFASGPTCFNEAPIHESGKYCLLHGDRNRFRRFNEAPIHESGKSLRGTDMAAVDQRLQ